MESTAAFVLACLLAQTSPAAQRTPVSLAHLPLAFIENRGQVDERVRFSARRGGMTASFACHLLISRPAERWANLRRRPAAGYPRRGPPVGPDPR